MGLFDVLSGAVDVAGHDIAASAGSIAESTLASLSVQVKTNLGPAFTMGGQAPSAGPAPAGAAAPTKGVLDYLGLKFSATVIDGAGHVVYTYGSPPATNYALAGVYLAAFLGFGWLTLRGARSLF